MNDKKIIMVDSNSINNYCQYKLWNHDAEFFGLKDGMEIIAYDDEDVWEAKVCYNPSAEYYEKWGIELGETIQILTEEERKWAWAGYDNGKSTGGFFKEVEVAEKLIDFGMEINDIQKIVSLHKDHLYRMKCVKLIEKFKKKFISNGGIIKQSYFNADLSEHPVLAKCNDKAFCTFLDYVSKAESNDSTAWFLCLKDYQNNDDTDGFSWNEFEKISLASAESDSEKEKIKKWWERHLPIAMSVNGEYTFLAIDLENGTIVQGYEPEFEDTETIAENFEELLKMIISGEFVWGGMNINQFRITVDETPEKIISLMEKKYDIKKYSARAYFIAGNIAEIYFNEDYDKDLTDSEDGWLYYNTNMDFFPTDKEVTDVSEKALAENIKSFFDGLGLKSEIIW